MGNGTSSFSQIKTQQQWLAKELTRLGSMLHRNRWMWMTCPPLEDPKFMSHRLPNPDVAVWTEQVEGHVSYLAPMLGPAWTRRGSLHHWELTAASVQRGRTGPEQLG